MQYSLTIQTRRTDSTFSYLKRDITPFRMMRSLTFRPFDPLDRKDFAFVVTLSVEAYNDEAAQTESERRAGYR